MGLKPDLREVDVADDSDVRAVYAAVCWELGVPVVLFNMATLRNTYLLGGERVGESLRPNFWEFDTSRVRRAVEANLLGTLVCTSAVVPDLVFRRRGSIVIFTTSLQTHRTQIPYGSTKAAVEAFTVAAANQLASYNVRVKAIASGGRTNLWGENDPRYVPSNWADDLVTYLAGAESEGVTGQIFRGGR